MGVEVISDEAEYCNPDIGLHPVLLMQRLAFVCLAREEQRHEQQRGSCGHPKRQVPPFVPELHVKSWLYNIALLVEPI